MPNCLFCGEETRGSNKFCNKKCSSKFHDKKRCEREKELRRLSSKDVICVICKQKIDNPGPGQKTHIGDCRKENTSRYRKARTKKEREKKPFLHRVCRCGREFKTRNPLKIMCREPDCLKQYVSEITKKRYWADPIRQKKYEAKIAEKRIEMAIEESQTMTVICPGCKQSRLHTFYPAWAGNPKVTPRIRCDKYPACIGDERNQYMRRTPEMAWEMGNGARL